MPEVLTGGGIPIASPATVAHHTMRYENAAIHRMLPTNVMMKNFFSGNIREERFIYISFIHVSLSLPTMYYTDRHM